MSLAPAMEIREYRNWAELPPELISAILVRLGTIDILENAQKVCRSWRRVCKDTSMWRKINMKYDVVEYKNYINNFQIMCRHAVDLSQGGLVKIKLWLMCSDDLLNYIANSSGNLKSLSFVGSGRITEQNVVAAIVKLPLLEEVEMSNWSFSSESLRVLGHSCPNMKTLKIRNYRAYQNKNDDAVAIAETMPGLRRLRLIANGLTNTGLNLILDNCPHLEYLDIRMCPYVTLFGDLEKRCYERIKVVKHPRYGILRK